MVYLPTFTIGISHTTKMLQQVVPRPLVSIYSFNVGLHPPYRVGLPQGDIGIHHKL